MNAKQKAEAFKAFKKAHEEAEKKVREITLEAQEFISVLLTVENIGEKINVVDTLNTDLYYEQILMEKYHLVEILRLLRSRWGIITEEEYSFVFQRMNDLVEDAKYNLEKIIHLISKLD